MAVPLFVLLVSAGTNVSDGKQANSRNLITLMDQRAHHAANLPKTSTLTNRWYTHTQAGTHTYTYTHTGRHTHTYTHRQAHTQACIHTHTHTHCERSIETATMEEKRELFRVQ